MFKHTTFAILTALTLSIALPAVHAEAGDGSSSEPTRMDGYEASSDAGATHAPDPKKKKTKKKKNKKKKTKKKKYSAQIPDDLPAAK